MRFTLAFGMFFGGFLAELFVIFWLFKGALGGLFDTLVAPGAAPGLWEWTFGHFWLSFVTFGVPFWRLWGPLGFVWAFFGRLWGALGVILDTLWREFGHLKALFAYIG